MNILFELRKRLSAALAGTLDNPCEFEDSIRPAQDSRFGDYQINAAMPLGKRLGKPPRDVAASIASGLDVGDFCEPPEIAGPGFINLKLSDCWLCERLEVALRDDRLGVSKCQSPETIVIDYSSPNVAKPMHVGHIRSTVIGDSIARTLRFLGHHVITDNHLGDWGTQFGMIIYGFKKYVDRDSFAKAPVAELSRLYRLVNRLVSYSENLEALPGLKKAVESRRIKLQEQQAIPLLTDKNQAKSAEKTLKKLESQLAESAKDLVELENKIAECQQDAAFMERWNENPQVADSVLAETAKLHAGDPTNRQLWAEFLPNCRDEIQQVYRRLNVRFDHELGESFYHDRLESVVQEFLNRGLAKSSEGALCVFMDGFEAPMIIRKKDGAYLYATTDLATIQYRLEKWNPDVVLYVVDHRQGDHFEKLFAAAKLWGIKQVDLRHISFGTVLGKDKKPFRTRSGDNVGLESLLDEAVARAYAIVSENNGAAGDPMPESERKHVAEVVGIAALKYADLSQNRTSDYEFSYDKMLAMDGNTATYMQYSYARVNGIFAKGEVAIERLRQQVGAIRLTCAAERSLAVALLRFSETLGEVVFDYRPNVLTNYLYELTKCFFTFYEECHVLKADSEELRTSRLLLCDLTARTIRQGLSLLGIQVIERM